MTIDELRKLLSSYKGAVSSRTKKAINEILSLSEEYSFLGSRFTFDYTLNLSYNVGRVLEQMTEELIEDAYSLSGKVSDGENDNIIAIFNRDNISARYESHTSRLKTMLEVYIGTAFANAYTHGELVTRVFQFLSNPPINFHFGRGVMTNPMDAYTVLGQNTINTAYQRKILQDYSKNPKIVGYRVHRGSSFPCDICDEATIGVHPLTEQVVPLHARCRCYTTPVYLGEE